MIKLARSSSGMILCCLCLALLLSTGTLSQSSLPPFKMYLSNNTVFSVTQLPRNKPVVVIYFDPDCDHCQKLMNGIFKKINSFKKTEMIMVTFKSIAEVAAFEKRYKTARYSNLRVGPEGTSYQLRDYYQLVKIPFTALYGKNQKLSYSYGQDASVDEIVKRVKDLN
ncbi:MAG TPA: redoxin domain-containing protein [Chitinophagaceae bacterium]|nr:redoxin domain-containing protein [Chitinophagaceae bacterium]